MIRWFVAGSSCCFLLGLIFAGRAAGAEMSPQNILESLLNAERDRPSVMIDLNIFQKYAHRKNRGKHFYVQFRQKAEMFDIISESFLLKDDKSREEFSESRFIWNGKGSFFRHQTQGGNLKAFVANKKRSMAWRTHAPYLYGVLDYGTRHYAELLLESSDLKVRPEQEAIDGFPCYVVTGDTANGHYTVWIDAENGFRYRKAIVHKVYDPPLQVDARQTLVSQTSEISGITVDSIEGFPIITKASKVVNNSYVDGMTTKDILEAKRSNIKWNPDFESVGAFKMDLPDGTIVRDMDFAIRYFWSNGELHTIVDTAALEEIEKTVQEVKDDNSDGAVSEKTKAVRKKPPIRSETSVQDSDAKQAPLAESPRFHLLGITLFAVLIVLAIGYVRWHYIQGK